MNKVEIRKNSPIPAEHCSLFKAADVIGDRWTMLILREAFYGVVRFDDMRTDLNIPKAALSGRLKQLVDNGILTKVPYREEGKRIRHYYRLTVKGIGLGPVLVAMMNWSDEHLRIEEPLVSLEHSQTQSRIRQVFVDDKNQIVDIQNVKFKIDPNVGTF
jgi:DNA-binding HxlR family transcriptional regulator